MTSRRLSRKDHAALVALADREDLPLKRLKDEIAALAPAGVPPVSAARMAVALAAYRC